MLLLILPLLGFHQEPPAGEKEVAMQRIRDLMEEGAWKEAVKAIESYRRKLAETEEEKAEASRLLVRARGEMELETIGEEYRKRSKVHATVARLNRFLEVYAEVPALVEKGEEFLETVRSRYVLEIEDFEAGAKRGWQIEEHPGVSPETDAKFVRHGRRSIRWKPADRESALLDIRLAAETDWTGYEFLCAWVHNEKKGRRPTVIRISVITGFLPEAWYECWLPVDWSGWQEVRIPRRGQRSRFSPRGKPDWSRIGRLMVHQEQGELIELVIDDIRLEKLGE